MTEERVAKVMARRGLCSRREAERLIGAGQVVVDGVRVEQQGSRCRWDSQIEIERTGRRWMADRLAVLVHKPTGIVSTQPEKGQTPAWKLLRPDRCQGPCAPEAMKRIREHPYYLNVAGRLDKDSRGLLLMTNHGVLAGRITGGDLVKSYIVTVDQPPTETQVGRLSQPMRLDGRVLKPMRVKRLGSHELELRLREGRKHQIRRCCKQVGLEVVDLLRDAIGPWKLDGLKEGAWRVLGEDEYRAVLEGGVGGSDRRPKGRRRRM